MKFDRNGLARAARLLAPILLVLEEPPLWRAARAAPRMNGQPP